MRRDERSRPAPTGVDVALSDQRVEDQIVGSTESRNRERDERAAKAGYRPDGPGGRRLLSEACRALEPEVKAWIKRASERPGPAHATASVLLANIKPGVIAAVAFRTCLDYLTGRTGLQTIANRIGSALEDEAMMVALSRKNKGSLWRDLSKRVRKTRTRGVRRKMVESALTNLGGSWAGWPTAERFRVGVVLLELIRMHTGFVEIANLSDARGHKRRVVTPTAKAVEWLDKAAQGDSLARPLWLPTRSAPADWKGAWGGGYRVTKLRERPLIKTKDRAALGALDGASAELHLGAANALQRSGWRVNRPVLEIARWAAESGLDVVGFRPVVDALPAGLPRRQPRKDQLDGWTPEQRVARERAIRVRSDYFRRDRENRGRALLRARTLWVAGEYLDAPALYFPVQADFRGRLYPQPLFLQPQGDDLSRALLEFQEGQPVADREAQDAYLSRGASLYGLGKGSVRSRVEAARGRLAPLWSAIGADPRGRREWAAQDDPWQALAFALDFAAHAARPGHHASHLPITVDHTSSGLQLYSLLTLDRALAEATNVAPSDAPVDLYQIVADDVTRRLVADPDPNAALWLEFLGGRVPRELTKRPIMTKPYGVKLHSIVNYVRDVYEEIRIAQGHTPFPELEGGAFRASTFLARHLVAAMEGRIGASTATMDWLVYCARTMTLHGLPIKWVSPSGFPVIQDYRQYASKRIRTAVGDVVRFVRYREDKAEISGGRQMNGFPPNYVHSVDSAIMARSVCRLRERGVRSIGTVHDSYMALAVDTPKVIQAVRGVCAEVFQADLLGQLRAELQRDLGDACLLPEPPERGDFDPREVLRSQHLLS
jgi:DNA-directed RNA polymerase